MALVIKIKSESGQEVEKVLLKAKKTIDGNIIVSDHPELDIIVFPNKSRLVAFPKDQLDDEVYETQKRLFDFLKRRGVIDYESVQAGNLFMSMEGTIPKAAQGDKIQYVLYVVSDFMDQDLPFYDSQKEYEEGMEKRLLDPEIDEYTEHDPDKYHSDRKGSLPPRLTQYGINTIYRL